MKELINNQKTYLQEKSKVVVQEADIDQLVELKNKIKKYNLNSFIIKNFLMEFILNQIPIF